MSIGFSETQYHILLISIFFIAGTVISGCSPATGEVEMMDPKQVYTKIAERGETTWDLVALGDSTPSGFGVDEQHSYVQVYAGYIEEHLGVDVAVHNWGTNNTTTVAGWVEVVRENQELRQDLQNAEVITIWLGWHDVIPSIGLGIGGPCYQQDDEVDLDCLREVTDPMQRGFNDLLSEIVALANPAETLILIADVGIPSRFVARWKAYGTLDLLKRQAYEVWRDYIVKSAGDHKVHVVHTYEVINGPNGDQETPSAYLQSDGLHFNEQGHKLLADIHHKIGSEDSSP
jgi:lysophospholipase L1-like esterase